MAKLFIPLKGRTLRPPLLSIPKNTLENLGYKKVRYLEHGLFGPHDKIRDLSTGDVYLLKTFRNEFLSGTPQMSRIPREIMAMSQLNDSDSPFLIKLRDYFQDGKANYLIVDYYPPARSLQVILEDYGRFHVDAVRLYSAEVINALEYIHGKGFVHRDIQPESIVMMEDWHIKLCDFGCATKIDTAIEDDNNRVSACAKIGNPCGNKSFTAPEILDRHAVYFSSDLWSLGCLMYCLYTGNYDAFEFHGSQTPVQQIVANPIDSRFENLGDDTLIQFNSLKRFVCSLLKIDHRARQGASNIGLLKFDMFYNVVYENWANLHTIPPPPLQGSTVPPPNIPGNGLPSAFYGSRPPGPGHGFGGSSSPVHGFGSPPPSHGLRSRSPGHDVGSPPPVHGFGSPPPSHGLRSRSPMHDFGSPLPRHGLRSRSPMHVSRPKPGSPSMVGAHSDVGQVGPGGPGPVVRHLDLDAAEEERVDGDEEGGSGCLPKCTIS